MLGVARQEEPDGDLVKSPPCCLLFVMAAVCIGLTGAHVARLLTGVSDILEGFRPS